jgi:hypothetical protein
MLKIKIIDLVNQISRKDTDLPQIIKYENSIYKFSKDIGDYRKDGWGECLLMKKIFANFDCQGKHNSFYNMLCDYVEKIEE